MEAENDDNHDDDQQSREQQVSTSQPKKRKGRGPSKHVAKKKPLFIDYDEFGMPQGDSESDYGKYIGECALKLDINAREWKNVDEAVKDMMWEATKKVFRIEEDEKGEKKKFFLSAVAARFRKYKSWLIKRFNDRTEAPLEGHPSANKLPWEVYEGYFTKDQWLAFEEYVGSEEFKVKSERGKKNAKKNVHRHILGQKSYSRARVEWVKQERLPAPSEDTTRDRLQNRALEWCLAHQKRTKDGKWEVDPKKTETVCVVDRVMEELEKEPKEKEEGTFESPERGVDALTKVLGKKDHRGYVKGLGRFGVGVGQKKAFGKVDQNSERAKGLEELEKRYEEKLQERVAMEV